jgi:hypothetical protein
MLQAIRYAGTATFISFFTPEMPVKGVHPVKFKARYDETATKKRAVAATNDILLEK